jgi:hypothetical protein
MWNAACYQDAAAIKPAPRLLETAAVEARPSSDTSRTSPRAKLRGSGTLRGNGRAIFMGLLLGALFISVAGYVHTHYHPLDGRFDAVRRFLVVRTHDVSNPTGSNDRPLLRVHIGPELLRVTAIALGHPRLAVINGKEVAEGDFITVKAYGGAVSATLKVENISEGRIELSNGSEIVTTRLPTPR